MFINNIVCIHELKVQFIAKRFSYIKRKIIHT